jgi:site-specific DNA-cytosine methylase
VRVLVACEESGVVRRAFQARGHHAISCDILPPRDGQVRVHLQADVRHYLDDGWDLLIAFPPCTDLSVSGARWFRAKQADGRQQAALQFVRQLMEARIDRIAIENPVSIISSQIRKPDQIIQPWMFGHGEVKTTCLWLKGLPHLTPTQIVPGRIQRCWRMAPSATRARDRAETYLGIATAMAAQWG